MPWCPKCKNEYREGITKCADCGATLVATLTEEKNECIACFSERTLAEKFIQFLEYSNLSDCEMSFDALEDCFKVFTTAANSNEAKKLFITFSNSESEKEQDTKSTSEKSTDSIFEEAYEEDGVIPLEKIIPNKSLTYVKKKDRYNDLRSTFFIFIVFGIGGLVFTGLNIAGVIHLFNNYLQYAVLSFVSIFFIFVAIKSFLDSKRIYSEIDSEEKNTDDIKKWLIEHMTKEELSQFDDETSSKEVIFFKKTEYMKKKLLEVYDIDNDSYIDEIIEEYYSEFIE